MNQLFITLPGGVLLIAVVFYIVFRLFSLPSKFIAALVAITALGAYVPVAIVTQPGADVIAIHVAVYVVVAYVLGIIASQYEAGNLDDEQRRIRFHWAPAAIIGFFLFVLAVNTVFILMAQSGIGHEIARQIFPVPRGGGEVSSYFPGTVTHDFQQREDEYNNYLLRAEQQELRGWRIHKGWLNPPQVGQQNVFQVKILDRNDQAIENAEIKGVFLRPADSRRDQPFTMAELGGGVYQAHLILSEAGKWDLLLTVRKDDAVHELKGTTRIASRAE